MSITPSLSPLEFKGNETKGNGKVTNRHSVKSNNTPRTNNYSKDKISSKRNNGKGNYYHMFGKAINQNKDLIPNSEEYAKEIRMLNNIDEIKDKEKRPRVKYGNDKKAEEAQLKQLAEQKAKNEQIVGPINPITNFDQANNNSSGDENTKRSKAKSTKKKKTKRSNNNGNNINDNNDDDEEEDESSKRIAIKAKRLRVLKAALAYLESNSIFLPEFLKKNPFQSKPFAMPYSTEFITSIKFSEFEAIRIALKANSELLFSFDYLLQTAFHWAAKLGDKKMLSILLSNGRACNQYDHRRCTPLYLAALNNQYDCCELLLNNYGNPFLVDINGKRPLDVASDPAIQTLLTKNMDQPYMNPLIKNKMTLLGKALNDKKVKKLLEAKAAKEKAKIKTDVEKEGTTNRNENE